MNRENRLKRLRYRAWHRGTREADLMVGGFFDRYGASWSDDEIAWFEAFIEEQDVDIMGWAMSAQPVPERWQGPMIEQLKACDYIQVPE